MENNEDWKSLFRKPQVEEETENKEIREPTDEEIDTLWEKIKKEHFRKPSKHTLINAVYLKYGSKRNRYIIRQEFVKDLMCDATTERHSINEAVTDRDIFVFIVKKMISTEFSKDCKSIVYHDFLSFINLFGKSLHVGAVYDFPFDLCRRLIRKYNTNGLMYDPSCGWGSRLSSAIYEGVNYVGTDPNFKLCPRLEAMGKFTKAALNSPSTFQILCQGSENHIDWLENKAGLILTSPPYFDVEDYKYGDQCYKEKNYDQWIETFFEPTIRNCYSYLTNEGHCILNIKNTKKYPMYDDMLTIADKVGFKVKCTEHLENAHRIGKVDGERVKQNSDEECAVFVK